MFSHANKFHLLKDLWFLPILGNCGQNCNKQSYVGFCVDVSFQLVWVNSKYSCWIVWYKYASFWTAKLSFRVVESICIPTNNDSLRFSNSISEFGDFRHCQYLVLAIWVNLVTVPSHPFANIFSQSWLGLLFYQCFQFSWCSINFIFYGSCL